MSTESTPSKPRVITIDGPGGAGKGTISQLLAKRLGYTLLDSGALYRLLALAARRQEVAIDDENSLAALARDLDIQFKPAEDGALEVWLEDKEVSQEVRTEACGTAASRVAGLPQVRAALLARQRQFLRPPGLVADGRDMGTIVFPDAEIKIFLTASLEERAKRRYKQLREQGISASLGALLNELAIRDERDANRSSAPLIPAEDATILDSTGLGIDRVLLHVLELAR